MADIGTHREIGREDGPVELRSVPGSQVPEGVRVPLHEDLVGRSARIREVSQLVRRLAQSDLTVLITGESGTGKDIAARLLHKLSPRYGKPFIKVNCPAIPESILESELFGYERGAFTGARASKPGRLELANHGSIFLDEIIETSLTVQGKLLQVLDGEPFMRIGGTVPVRADVRIIAATNIPLEEIVKSGRMREDLYFRLSEVIVRMPALRERLEDLPLLAEHFNYNFCTKLGRAYKPLPVDAVQQMQQLRWPGNVRELGARVKKFVATGNPRNLYEDEEARPHVISEPLLEAASAVDRAPAPAVGIDAKDPSRRKFMSLKEATRRAVESTERALIEEALRFTLWNRRKAAQLLAISYSSLLRRIDAYNIGKSDGGQ